MTTEREYLQLFDVLDPALMDHPDYADRAHYRRWERDIAAPALEALGYAYKVTYTGEADSFGPLSRVMVADKDGTTHYLVYG